MASTLAVQSFHQGSGRTVGRLGASLSCLRYLSSADSSFLTAACWSSILSGRSPNSWPAASEVGQRWTAQAEDADHGRTDRDADGLVRQLELIYQRSQRLVRLAVVRHVSDLREGSARSAQALERLPLERRAQTEDAPGDSACGARW